MTKEELEKETEEWLDKRYLKDMGVRKPCKQAYLAGAEPREKRIEELEECIKDLQKDCENKTNVIADYTNKLAICNTSIAELEAQINKMKRCEICKHHSSISGCSYHSECMKDCKKNGMKLFELKEIKEK